MAELIWSFVKLYKFKENEERSSKELALDEDEEDAVLQIGIETIQPEERMNNFRSPG